MGMNIRDSDDSSDRWDSSGKQPGCVITAICVIAFIILCALAYNAVNGGR